MLKNEKKCKISILSVRLMYSYLPNYLNFKKKPSGEKRVNSRRASKIIFIESLISAKAAGRRARAFDDRHKAVLVPRRHAPPRRRPSFKVHRC